MKRRSFVAGAGLFALAPSWVSAQLAKPVAIAGDRFSIDGVDYQLSDIIAPSPFALHAEFEPGEAAGEDTRWGARVVNATSVTSGENLQAQLVRAGAARVAPRSDDFELIDELLAAERIARREAKGLWAMTAYKVHDALDAHPAIGGFHLIEGRVVNTASVKGRFYLNFSEDYPTDFTASTISRNYRIWADDGFDLGQLINRNVRVRGYVSAINGPSITVVHRRQVELL